MSKWYDEAVFYHMYPLGLVGAPKYQESEEVVHRFTELEEWVPHMAGLGCTAVYIGPLFESGSHGYDTWDYKKVDRRLGSNEDFVRFVQKCHEAGLRVVVDGVFNHTGREFFAFQDLRRNRENSRYRNWYRDVNFGGDTHYHDGFWYNAWHNCFELPALNQWNDEVKQYLFDVIRFWIREFDIDGIRLDCADCLDFQLLRDMRSMTGQEKEDFWLMGEVIHGDYARWTEEGLLHSVTNYELHKGLYSGHNDHNYFEIAHTIRRQFDENGGIYKGRRLYSFVDNHDVDRLASKLNNPEHLKLVWTLLFTLPGIPSIYYGSEWGITGKKEGPNDDPMRPRLKLSEQGENPSRPELVPLIKRLARLKKEEPALTEGAYRELLLRNRQYAFARVLGDTAVITAVNNDDQGSELVFSCPGAGDRAVEELTGKEIRVENGTVCMMLEPNSAAVFVLGAHVRREEPVAETAVEDAQERERDQEDGLVKLEDGLANPENEQTAWDEKGQKSQALQKDLTSERKAARERAVFLANEYNGSYGRPAGEREEILRRLLKSVGEDVHFEPSLRCAFGDGISIGDHFYGDFDCMLVDDGEITIGDHVCFGPRVGIYTREYAIDAQEREAGACSVRPVRIGNHVCIGAGVHIHPGVTIGDYAVIASGSIVTEDIPARAVAAGAPCRVIREIAEADKTGYSL